MTRLCSLKVQFALQDMGKEMKAAVLQVLFYSNACKFVIDICCKLLLLLREQGSSALMCRIIGMEQQ